MIQPNNPLAKPMEPDEIAAIIGDTLDGFAFFCRSYNLPLDANLYTTISSRTLEPALGCSTIPGTVIARYMQTLFDTSQLSYSDEFTDKWKEVSREWEKVKTHRQLLEKIKLLKEDFTARSIEKWGAEYNFDQYLQLETQFHSIIQSLNVTNPTQIANIQKVCKMSLMVDELIRGGDIKAISDATKALSQLYQLAKIEEMSEVAAEGTIKTVADLYKYMEDHGFQFNYYDQVDRDIVDKTLKDIQDSIRTNLNNAVGLDVTLQTVKENYLRGEEEAIEAKAQAEISIDDIIASDGYTSEDNEIDNALAQEEVVFED